MYGAAVKRISDQAFNILFPRRCALCGENLLADALSELCGQCRQTLSINDSASCRLCGQSIDGSLVDAGIVKCGHCRIKEPPLEAAVFGLRYEGTAREIIHKFKFGGGERLAAGIAHILSARLHRSVEMDHMDMVIPVPLHIGRLYSRGYNQSYLIAREVGRVFSLPVDAAAIFRRRATPAQWSQTRAQRFVNMKNAFGLRKTTAISGKRLLLVDDIMTTGATMFEAARLLKKSGAAAVVGAVAARA
ncbi:MAG: phosphoribosyltransferase family protein [Nitrospinota bacterium]